MDIYGFEQFLKEKKKMVKTALITGISGQDGAYISNLLFGK